MADDLFATDQFHTFNVMEPIYGTYELRGAIHGSPTDAEKMSAGTIMISAFLDMMGALVLHFVGGVFAA